MPTFIDNGVTYSYTLLTPTTARLDPGATGTSGVLTIPQGFDLSGTTITITEIYDDAFSELATGVSNNITSVIIPATVTTIGTSAFRSIAISGPDTTMSVLTSVIFDGVSQCTSIGEAAFLLSGISSITIPASVTIIGDWCFYNTPNLSNVTFIASTNWATGITIGASAFLSHIAVALTTVFIKDGQKINGTAYSTGSSYTLAGSPSVPFKSYVIDGYGVFNPVNYTNAGSPPYAVLSGWTSIGNAAFQETAITSITIPASVTSIENVAFYGCTSLASVSFAAGSELATIGNYAFLNTAITSIEIPASVNSIGDIAFWGCTRLASVTFAADSVLDTIGFQAFENNTGLTSITIPASVDSIGNKAFYGCASLASVTFAADSELATIGTQVFTNSGLNSLTIPQSLLTIFGVNEGSGQTVIGKTNVNVIILSPPAPSNICFPAGTPVLTDQGEVAIDKIDPEKHTIRTNKIEGITKTTSIENYVVMIKKDAFSRNVPCRDTTMSANHKIMFKNQMVQARDFVDKNIHPDNIYKIPYSGETLYNVLLETKHDLMIVNNLIAETLSPNSINAWLFRKLKSDISNAERKEAMNAYMQRVFPAPVLSSFMIGCK